MLPFSQLAKKGAYSEKMIYTKEDIFKFINDAMSRGVHVIPEIDMLDSCLVLVCRLPVDYDLHWLAPLWRRLLC